MCLDEGVHLSIPTAILLFKRKKADDSVLFIDASREFEQGTKQNRLRPTDIDKIVATYRRRESMDRYAYLASFAEIKGNDYDLNIPRYVDMYEPEAAIDIMEAQREIDGLETKLAALQSEMKSYLEELGYGA